MKTALCSLGLLALGFVAPLGCDHQSTNPIVTQPCAQMGFVYNDAGEIVGNQYEFLPVGDTMGSFEEGFVAATDGLIIDDDDLIDDYPIYVEALKIADELMRDDSGELLSGVLVFESMDPEKQPEDYTDAENEAIELVEGISLKLLEAGCSRLGEALIAPRPGDQITENRYPSFTACKDRYNASGDGFLEVFDLARENGQAQDLEVASCPTVTGAENARALNVWGPLSTGEPDVDWISKQDAVDGFTYSGITVPLKIADYQRTDDRSEWDGVAFWARVADAEEAVPLASETSWGVEIFQGKEIPEDARPQDGVGQVGIIIQTMDTAAVLARQDIPDNVDAMKVARLCDESALEQLAQFEAGEEGVERPFCFETEKDLEDFDGMESPDGEGKFAYEDTYHLPQSPQHPFCIDYSPVDAVVGKETPYRDQCWDGFRTMVDVSPEWKFYFLPFNEMRQAGWGRVGDSFRTDQIRSVNILTSAFQPVNIMVDEIAYYRMK